jgi:hypothetical protein
MPINSGYGNNSSFTNASGPSGMDVSPYLAALLQRERQHLEQRAAPAAPRRGSPFGMNSAPVRMPVSQGSNREATSGEQRANRAELALLEAKAQQAKAQAQAMNSRIPTRMSTVGGQTFATPDHLAMTGAQRQVFLPQNAEMSAPQGMSAADADFLARMRAGRTVGQQLPQESEEQEAQQGAPAQKGAPQSRFSGAPIYVNGRRVS